TQSPTNRVIARGDDTTFQVVATGDQPLYYQWRFSLANAPSLPEPKSGTSGATNPPTTWRDLPGATNALLLLKNVHRSRLGDYAVTVSNATGVVTSQVATLSFARPPIVTVQPGITNVALGGSVG